MFSQSMGPPSFRPPQLTRPGGSRPPSQQSVQSSIQNTRRLTRGPSFEDSSMSIGKRRSLSLTRRRPFEEVRSSDDHSMGLSSPLRFHFQRHEGSEAGSVASAPTLKHHPRELRDPQSTTARSIPKGKQYRDESPPGTRKPLHDATQKHAKSARKLVEELNQASESNSHERRIAAITSACIEFDHADEQRHNKELEQGAAKALTGFITTRDDEDELRMACSAMEMVFRAESGYVLAALKTCGSVLLPTLMQILERAETAKLNHADVIILTVSRVLLYLSRVMDLRTNLARNKGILDFIQRVSLPFLNSECRVVRLRIAANLANSDENKAFLYESPGFIDALLLVAHSDTTDLARDYAVMVMMDLASSPANQIPMAANEKVLGTLVKVVLVEEMASARESAITALQNLAFAKENRTRLVVYKEGIVLEALRKALSGDVNEKARRRASGALTNLACHETAEVMGNHRGLLDTLAFASAKDVNSDVQGRAAMALTKLAASITMEMPCYDILLDALVVASLSQACNSVAAVLRLKARDPENRETMARHPGVLDTLADICVSGAADLKDKDNAMRALMHLTNESNNRKVMCSKKILDAMVKGASMDGVNTEDIRDSAIRALERLATEFSNRAYMARQEGLLVVVAQATEREAKLEEAGTNPGRALLAKPLLMSLLVAM